MTDIENKCFQSVGSLPPGWVYCRNDALYLERSEFCDADEPTDNLLSVSEYYGVARRKDKIDDEIISRAETLDGYRRCYQGDLVMNYMLAWKGAQATSELAGVVSPSYAVFKPIGPIDPKFAHYLYRTEIFCGLFEANSTGIIKSRLRLYPKTFLKLHTILPPLPEQQAIVRYLDRKCAAIDEAIERHKKIIEKLEEYRGAEITRLATKGFGHTTMKDSGSDLYGYIPSDWEVKRFKYIAKVVSNLVDPEPYMDLPQVGPDIIEKDSGRLVGKRTVEEAGIISGNHLFYEGQLLYSKVRPALNKVATAPFTGLCSADMYPIEAEINSEYLKWLMLSNPFTEQTRIIASIRVKMPKINQDELGDVMCVVPPMEEQEKIALAIQEMCDKVRTSIDKHNDVISKIDEYRKSVIYNAVTGKIDCREAGA